MFSFTKQKFVNIFRDLAVIFCLLLFVRPGHAQTTPPLESDNCQETQTSNSGGWFSTFSYYLSKVPEAWSLLNYLDLKMVHVGTKASQQRFHSRLEWIKLNQILLFHPITTNSAKEKTKQRGQKILSVHKDVLEEGGFTAAVIEKLLPSPESIQVVSFGDQFLVIQGQGRVQSFKDVLNSDTKIQVEVSEVPSDILLELQSVRNAYREKGLL